jgi:N-acetylglucosaminyl-diphospho-decaprenol L-rhamnosyltransferase
LSHGAANLIAVSIVSHGHGSMVESLVKSLIEFPEVKQIFVTRNIPEPLALVDDSRVSVISNAIPLGFGANHNAAFSRCRQPTFCVLNPDIMVFDNPFPRLLAVLRDTGAALVAPLVKAPGGEVEDSMRYFPTLLSVATKAFRGSEGRHVAEDGQTTFFPEWVAGMFMLFRSLDFQRLGGFDEDFFLYYEDVDICVRAWKRGMRVAACTEVEVVHDARRDSRRKLRHFLWHSASVARYLWKHWGRLPGVT